MIEINNKTVFITGGANGIGSAIVKECLKRGAKHVAFLDVDVSAGTKLADELGKKFGKERVKFIECDVTNDQLFSAYKMVHEDNGGIDCVVNNAGIAQERAETYKKLININFTALVTSTLKGLELMRKDRGGKGGTIMNISSVAALRQITLSVFIYCASKSAVLHFSNCIGMQDYFDRTGVRVIAVCFDGTDTKIFSEMTSSDPYIEEALTEHRKSIPFQSVESAARGLLDVYEMGECGETWVVTSDKPAVNWTEKVKKAYDILSEGLP